MLRVGLLSVAHLHVGAYVAALGAHPRAEIVGLFDHDDFRARGFEHMTGIELYERVDDLLDA